MSKLHNDDRDNLVSFLRHNRPTPPDPHLDCEQRLIDLLEPQVKKQRLYFKTARTWGIIPDQIRFRIPTKLIATGFLFTSVSFGVRTPRLALEPKDLENFLVKNWQNTLENSSYNATEETEAYWLLPTISEPVPTLTFSPQ